MPVNGWEFVILIVLAVVILGPERLPEYAAKLARFVVTARDMANNAKGQLKEQMGPEFEEVNWRQYDPRQYDPRKIVREALLEPAPVATRPTVEPQPADEPSEVAIGTPWDPDAT
ncbi:preprotein translocase subunit TatA [Janibacter sp. GXQ6167]|uniref:preprotein translocase subunit TatA n=1 Tax=Janibacter sp. GXQ6167 TaxID=3240791 RepID=UPI0035256D86